jgi:hypothetical protein
MNIAYKCDVLIEEYFSKTDSAQKLRSLTAGLTYK